MKDFVKKIDACTHFTLLSFLEHYDYIHPTIIVEFTYYIHMFQGQTGGVGGVEVAGIGDKKNCVFSATSW